MKFDLKAISKTVMLVLYDLLIIYGLNILVFSGYFSEFNPNEINSIAIALVIFTIFKLLIFALFKQYRVMLSSFGLLDSLKLATVSVVSNIVCFATLFICLPFLPFIFVDVALLIMAECVLIVGMRLVKRVIRLAKKSQRVKTKRTIIIGAGFGGKLVYDECKTNDALDNKVVAFIDDDNNKIGKLFSDVPVYGPISNAKEWIEKYQVEEVIIAIADLDRRKMHEILEYMRDCDVRIKRLPLMSEMSLDDKKNKIVNVDINELLSRKPIQLDNEGLHDFINGKKVLVTGAGGSIGSELVRQIYSHNPDTIILFDIYENAVYDVQQSLIRQIKRDESKVKLVTLIGATYNEARMENIFKAYEPQLVFHAAAYKHVPLMEDSPAEAIRSNVIGTYNVAKLADKYKVEKMVLVSTDKAVRPTNVMGATKRFAEMIIQYFASESKSTAYSAVRFGNVLGSNGSVIPLFKKQIEEGGPVTVTHEEITRFFMTIPEAVGLILQSAVYAKGGEIFILDMGKPVKIAHLARKMIRQAGYEPYTEIPIEIIGLRPGEKIYEELLLDVTTQIKTENEKIYIERPSEVQPVLEEIQFISQVFEIENVQEVKDLLAKVITTYRQPERDKVKV
ncbi:MAG: polysaccharide biosynthesis protein [Erysipelotrichales bacterium]|nr:polysaccharide biosynthesis protein [Erysipelotrichales bacterium]